MSRIIINNESDVDDWQAVDLIRRVIEAGRISDNGAMYCRATVFHATPRENWVVVAKRTRKGSDVFTIYEQPRENND